MPYALRRAGIPGAVVVIVKDGRVLAEAGYGVSNESTGENVDPQKTLFRLGSISKLFTWTAVMQLVEQGKLELDRDINGYLDFTIPPFHGKAITLRNLMTHTSGFEEASRGIATMDPADIPSLGDALKRWTPKRVHDPGTTTAYSNYGAALAGYIVQRVSGEPFEDYIANHIFQPLGMQHSSFAEPLPAPLLAALSRGYEKAGASPGPFEYVVWKPAGSLASTGADMAAFMIAHLQPGRPGCSQILHPGTAQTMHSAPPGPIPKLSAMGFGFENFIINGHAVIGHEGDTALFHSSLRLFPSDNVGIFLSLNSPGSTFSFDDIRVNLFEAFADRYFPAGPSAGWLDAKIARQHAGLFASAYSSSRASQSNFRKTLNLLREVRVVANADGTISVSALQDLSGALRRYREITPFVWNQVNGHDRIAAVVDGGQISRFGTEDLGPVLEFIATPAWMRQTILLPPLYVSISILLLTLLSAPCRALLRRWCFAAPSATKRTQASPAVQLTSFIALLAVAGWAWVLLSLTTLKGSIFVQTHLTAIHCIQAMSFAGFPCGLAAVLIHLVQLWKRSTLIARVWISLQAASMTFLVFFSYTYHLLSFNTNV